MRTMTSSEAKTNFGEVLSSLNSSGPIEITRNGKSVGLLTLPPAQAADAGRLAALASAYAQGRVSWPQITEETGASFGELLLALGLQKLSLPKVMAKKSPEQTALLNQVFDAAAGLKAQA
ncbi:MAG: type II toxin-antitoxin system Phd/YefM family antitoxin [Rhodoferax sp.]|uniref:type II toxin-antitoxin system Phd/YefM family antitoxin n=1 Tax=Rhodoferax sp. TaxID=50421 RepID=UPI002628D3AB|nr:type II toxin-antitoxin system Phd/YefM family antitoxin [Rhodoferax sp.]MDD2880851.1 type II toxin-antitoxin system Phd/YefM family antitoxin [Rhodoferax sp.]